VVVVVHLNLVRTPKTYTYTSVRKKTHTHRKPQLMMAGKSNQPKAPPPARAGGGASGDDDVRLLAREEELERIMEMLKTHSSEVVRQRLNDHKPRFDEDSISGFYLSKTDLVVKDLLDTPFFTMKGLRPISEATMLQLDKMTSGTSKSKRGVRDNYYLYDVDFVHWKNFSSDVSFEKFEENAVLSKEGGAAKVVSQFLRASFEQQLLSSGDKSLELGQLATPLNKVLRCFGFLFVKVTGPDCDIEVRTGAAGADEDPAIPFLFLEGKESCKLPRCSANPSDLWADLCLFGFATQIARTTCPNETMEERRVALSTLLGLKNLIALKNNATTLSPMVKDLLSPPPLAQIPSVAARVIAQLNLKMIEPTDAVFLWGAVMQACHYSVLKKRNRSIVLSARMFWYIELETTASKCTLAMLMFMARSIL
jgi:hypothetical protein